ncbi:MAG: hypothetical protein ACXV3D_09895 [Halobacteriota archaeon]
MAIKSVSGRDATFYLETDRGFLGPLCDFAASVRTESFSTSRILDERFAARLASQLRKPSS